MVHYQTETGQGRLHEAKTLVYEVLLVTYPDKGTFESCPVYIERYIYETLRIQEDHHQI